MRASQFFFPTLREEPTEAELVSHALLLRGGFIRRVAAGVYTYLPLGWRVLRKIVQIVREEMDRAGGQEILMPTLNPAELWQKTGRWEEYGELLFRLKDRKKADFCLGPTHEEVVTALVANELRSYRQLPLLLYQITPKFRDELRPRGGLIRGREFLMKDLYSFDRDEEGLEVSYRKMYDAYCRIFERCGLNYIVVEAAAGAIGGSDTREFMVPAETGEDTVLECDTCGYAANREFGEYRWPQEEATEPLLPLERVATPGQRTVEEVTAFLGVPASRLLKTLLYIADGQVVGALIRGDREVHLERLRQALGAQEVVMADPETVERVSGAPVGFAGPVGLEGVPLIADVEVPLGRNWVTGGNEADVHLRHVNLGRDFQVAQVAPIRFAEAGDGCPRCPAGRYREVRGIEVGHIFKLGTKYSQALGCTFQDEEGRQRFAVMGCYGIGVSRIMAAVVETSHDERGILWPLSIAPFHFHLLLLNERSPQQVEVAERLYQRLTRLGYEVLYDDRAERPGVKFHDADLIGIPLQIVVGRRTEEKGVVEVRRRRDGFSQELSLEEAEEGIVAALAQV